MSAADSLPDPKDPNASIDSVIEDYQSSGLPDKRSTYLFSYFSALYLGLLSLPLIAYPSFLVVLLGPSLVNKKDAFSGEEITGSYRSLNELELYLSRLVGLSFITMAALIVLQTGAIPVSSSLAHENESSTKSAAAYRQPTIFFSTLFFSLFGFSSWNVGLKFIGAAGLSLGAGGLWLLLFSGDPQAQGKKSYAIFGDSKSA